MHTHVTPVLTAQILDAGQNLDYIDAEAILALGVRHPVLVLPRVTRLAPEVIDKLAAYVRGGGHIIAVGGAPSLAPGHLDAARVSATVAAKAKALFAHPNVRAVANDDAVGAALQAVLAPDMKLSAQASDVGFVRRKLRDADIYFIANTSNRPVHAQASFAAARKAAAWIAPDSGRMTAATLPARLDLAPYESRVLVLADTLPSAPATQAAATAEIADLGRGWNVRFPTRAVRMDALRSWTIDDATRYFSGVATYEKDVELTAAQLAAPRIVLDFGPGTPLATAPKVLAGMRAMLESPVREAAEVVVNGRRAGAVWHPPYAVDVTGFLKPGRNRIEVRVGNLALNAMAGRALPDYRLLSARYGQRFVPQDTALIAPQPSGLLGPIKLLGGGQ
jgi:hypothetical protein